MATDGQAGNRLQVRKYPSSETLLDAAKYVKQKTDRAYCSVQSMTDRVDLTSEELCKLCLQLAIEVRSLHGLNWIHRDLRCKNVLITHKSKQMLFARISRMVELKSSVFCGEVFEDSIRWAAPEVVHNGVYSKKSDIFSLVTTFFELFHVADSCRTLLNPHPLSLFPLANVEKDGVANLVQEGVLLPQPRGCPDELYNLISDGRNPDCQARPDIAAVIDRLQKLCASFGVKESECATSPSTNGEEARCRSRDGKNKGGIRRVVNKIRTKLRRESEHELANCYELGYISAERLESLKSKTNAEAADESSQKYRYNNNNPLNAGTTNTVFSTQTSLRDTVPRFPSEKKKPSGPLPPIPSDHSQNEAYENHCTEDSLQKPVARSTSKTRREYFPPPIPSDHSQKEEYENHCTEDSLQKPVARSTSKTRREYFPPPIPSDHSQKEEYENHCTEDSLQKPVGHSTSKIGKRFFPPPPDSDYENVSEEDRPSSSQGQACVIGSMTHARMQQGFYAWNKQSCSDMASNQAESKHIFCPVGHWEIRKVTARGDVTSPCHKCLQMMPLSAVQVYENIEELDHAALTESPEIAPHPREMHSNLSGSSTSCSVPNAYENLVERDCADDENPYEPYVNISQDCD
ncbi:uncharacterized protein [Littorina saxatilis]|uniref:uncharacterized protein n=1 Tax=Littorina saxatilis TaxID=31220 RepID=UPI0038B5EDF0